MSGEFSLVLLQHFGFLLNMLIPTKGRKYETKHRTSGLGDVGEP